MGRTLAGARVLLTGASGSIGREVARQAAQAGARVALVARSAEAVAELAAELSARGADAVALPGDVTLHEDRERVLRQAADRFDGLDVLINNAAVASFGHFATGTEEVLREVMEVNFFAPAEFIRQAVPVLSRGRSPAVVNVLSVCGRLGFPAWSEYSASKAALAGLTESLRGELARFEIDILTVVPGRVKSESRRMLRHAGMMKRDYTEGIPPERVARALLQGLVRNRPETVVGSDASWILRVHRFFPRLVEALMARAVRRLYRHEVVAS